MKRSRLSVGMDQLSEEDFMAGDYFRNRPKSRQTKSHLPRHQRYHPVTLLHHEATALLSVAIAATTTVFAPHRSHPHHSRTASSAAFAASTTKLQATTNNMPICIVVEAEIKEDRMDDFLSMIEKNAVGSREEPGCIRFGM